MVIYDKSDDSYYACRDHLGKIPLYIGYGADGSVWFASEMKALAPETARFELFPPGHFYSSKTKTFTRWYDPVEKPGLLSQRMHLTQIAFVRALNELYIEE